MVGQRRLIVVVAIALAAGACNQAAETPTRPPPTTQTSEVPKPTVAATTSTTLPRATRTTTTQQQADPWAIDVVPVNDYAGVDMTFGIEEIIRSDAWIEATILSIGDPDTGRWCCDNPPLQVENVIVIGGEFTDDSDGWLNGIDYQRLDTRLEVGDRVSMLLRDGQTAVFVFGRDEGLAHPAPEHQAEAIDAMRIREASSAGGLDPIEYSPLRAVTDIWRRYHTDWWGSMNQRVALAVSGVPGYPLTCSAADLGRLLSNKEYAPASANLPPAVLRTRNELVAATTTCNHDDILALTKPTEGDDTDAFWWSAGSSTDTLIEADRRFGSWRELTLALTNTTVYKDTTDNDASGGASDSTYYVWPSAFVVLSEDYEYPIAPMSTALGEEEAARVAALNATTVEYLDETIQDFGGYAWFRTAIDATGRWRYALSGD